MPKNQRRLNVFISSTSTDLKEHREAVRDIVLALGFHPIMMEYFPAMDANAVKACMDKVDESDIYVGIFAYRYGYIPQDSNISITEMEFKRAKARNIPCLCFLVDEDADWHGEREDEPGRSRLIAFKKRLDQSLVRATFDTPDSLALEVSKSLQVYRPEPLSLTWWKRWRLALLPFLLVAGLLIGLYIRANTPPPKVSLAYSFLVDTSEAMNEVLPNGLKRYEVAREAIQQIAGVPDFDVSDIWRGLRLAGSGDCDDTERVTAGMQTSLPLSGLMEPLYRMQPYGGNAYVSGIRGTIEDMILPEPSASNVKMVFLFLGSLEAEPCGDRDRLFDALQGYQRRGILSAVCTFTLGIDIPGFQRFQEEAQQEGLSVDCMRNVGDEDEISQFAISVIRREIRSAQGMTEEQITPNVPSTRIVMPSDGSPEPSITPIDVPNPATPTPTPTLTPTQGTPVAQVSQPIEVRSGPGQQYDVVATIEANQSFNVVAVSEDQNWAQLALESTPIGWVSLGGQPWQQVFNVPSDVVLPTVIWPTETSTITPSPTPTSTPTDMTLIVVNRRTETRNPEIISYPIDNCFGQSPIQSEPNTSRSTTAQINLRQTISAEIESTVVSMLEAEFNVQNGETVESSQTMSLTANAGQRVIYDVTWSETWIVGELAFGDLTIPFEILTGIKADITGTIPEPCSTETSTSPDTSEFISTPSSNAVTVTIFRDEDSLTVYVPETDEQVSLAGLVFQVEITGQNRQFPLNAYSSFGSTSILGDIRVLGSAGCFTLVRNGSRNPRPLECQGGTTSLTQNLADADLFWYDATTNGNRTILVLEDGNVIAVCAAGQTQCDIKFPVISGIEFQSTPGYPCDGTIVVSTGSGVFLNQVYTIPQNNSPNRSPVAQGSTVTVLGTQLSEGVSWYQIQYDNNEGWIQSEYVTLSSGCPG